MRWSKRLVGGLGLAVILNVVLVTSAVSQEVEMTGVRAMGMGEAFTGGPSGAGSFFYNPAGISTLMMYSIESSYVYDQGTGRNIIHASIVDGKSNPHLGGGVAYNYSTTPDDANLPDYTGHDFFGALAAPIVPGIVVLGAQIHYLTYEQLGDKIASGITMDAGVYIGMGDSISFGAAGRNLISVDGANLPRETRFGLAYRSQLIHLGFDTLLEFTPEGTVPSYMVGFEIMAIGSLPLRVGYKRAGNEDHNIITGGVGWRSEMVGVDALYYQNVNASSHRMFGIAVNLYL